MKAKIFFIESVQESLCNKISRQLRTIIDIDIDIEKVGIPKNYNNKSSPEHHKAMDSYLRMLRSSMIKFNDFYIKLEYSTGNWCYIGGEYSQYTSYYSHNLTLNEKQMESIFPAVAMMHRMTLLPTGIDETFEKILSKEDFHFLFKPINLQGVGLIDFDNEVRLKNVITDLKGMLNKEIAAYCNRYIEIKNSPKANYTELSKLLDINEEYLQRLEPEILVSRVKITPSTKNKKIPLAKKTSIQVDFLKETKVPIDEVYIEIRAPFEVLDQKVVKKSLQFSSNDIETQSIQCEVTPKTYPFCPLEIKFAFNEIKYGNNPIPFPVPLILEVENNIRN